MPARGRLYAGWLAAHGLLALLPVTSHGYLDWQPFKPWVMHLEANIEGTPANSYTIVLWGMVGALALAQVTRPADGCRWLWLAGWISFGIIACMIAAEEHADLKWRLGLGVALLERIPGPMLWIVVITPLLALLAPQSVYVLYKSVRRHAVLAVLAGSASISGIAAVAHEVVHDVALSYEIFLLYEEGLEIMAAAFLCVVLVELLIQHRYAAKRVVQRIA